MLFNFPKKPGAGESPKPSGRSERNAEFLRRLLVRKSDEETKFHEFSSPRIDDCEAIQRFIQREQFVIRHGQWNIDSLQIHPLQLPAMFKTLLAPRRLHENPPHGLRRCPEEMRAILKLRLFLRFE